MYRRKGIRDGRGGDGEILSLAVLFHVDVTRDRDTNVDCIVFRGMKGFALEY